MGQVDVAIESGTAVKAHKIAGTDQIIVLAKASITSGDSIGSIYRLAQIPIGYIPVGGEITTAGITDLTDVDLGIYKDAEKGGAEIDKDMLVNGVDLSSAKAIGSGVNPLKDYGTANQQKTLAEVASLGFAELQTCVLALTINAAAGATGDIYVKLILARGV